MNQEYTAEQAIDRLQDQWDRMYAAKRAVVDEMDVATKAGRLQSYGQCQSFDAYTAEVASWESLCVTIFAT